METTSAWASETFSQAKLVDKRLVSRLIDMAAAGAERPGGTVTKVMCTVAQREGAFRFLESERLDSEAIAVAMFESTAQKCRSPITYVAMDQTSLSFTDRDKSKGLGPSGDRTSGKRRALQIMGAYAMDDRGVPVGLIDQQTWLWREKRTTRYEEKRGRWIPQGPPEERESIYWPKCLAEAKKRFANAGCETTPWYLADRGADSNIFLKEACESGGFFTLRSNINRAIKKAGERRKLHSTVKRQKVMGTINITIPPGPDRTGRIASLELRQVACQVRIDKASSEEHWKELSCIRVREVGHVPSGEERIEWKLLTNYPVGTFEDGLMVLNSYTLRWRIEEFHKTWKSGACDVESSQLRSLEALKRWATILAAVAARIERLKRLSREQPNLPALSELSRHEIDAAIMLTKTRKHAVGDDLTLQQAVALIGILGGHMGRKGDGPPGSITIRRGLELVTPAASVLRQTYG